MRTASIVARGSRPKSRPVTISSTTPVANAKKYGSFTSATARPVIAASRSRICFSVKILSAQNVALARSSLLQRLDMAARALGRIHQIQSRLHVRRKFSLEKIHHDASRRSRFDIALANRRRGIHDHYIDSRFRGLDCHLLGHELRTLVVPDHVRDARPGSPHRPKLPFFLKLRLPAKSHGRHTRRVHDAPHALFPRRIEQRTRALDIRAVHLSGIAHPQPVVGGNMKYNVAARSAFSIEAASRRSPATRSAFRSVKVAQIARRPHQQPQPAPCSARTRAT
jgi:hypothetical protein